MLGQVWFWWWIELNVHMAPFLHWMEYPVQPIPMVLPF